MAQSDKTPIWLHLRKEYIDDNFPALVKYLQEKSSAKAQDDFYNITLDLLRQRIEVLTTELGERPIFESETDKRTATFNLKLLACYLLVEANTPLGMAAYAAFMNELSGLHPRLSEKAIQTIMLRLKHEKVASLGFTWVDIDKIGTELFAYNACSLARFEQPLRKPLCYTRFGTALLTCNGLFLSYETQEKAKALIASGASSMDTGIGIAMRTASANKLKQSLENDLVEMDEFTKDFVMAQCCVQSKRTEKVAKTYEDGAEVVIKVTSIERNGTVRVETTDPTYVKLTGVIKWKRPSLVYYYTSSLYEYFQPGDFFKATVTDSVKGTFSLDDQLVNFFVEDTKSAENEGGSVFLCKLIDDQNRKFGWLNQYGVAFYTDADSRYKKGDFADLEVKSYSKGQFYGAINAKIYGDTDDSFDEKQARHDCIRAFAEMTEEPVYKTEEQQSDELKPVVLRLLLRQMFEHQKTQLKPSDRFRLLANANVIAELIGDDSAASFIRYESTYLRLLVQFVNGQDISKNRLIPEEDFRMTRSALVRQSIIQLLQEYGKKENSAVLANAIADFEESFPLLAKLARLIQTANSMQGTLTDASINVIRREIIRTLSLETENDADLEADSGTYLGVESGTVEFKTSMIFPPGKDAHMQADEPLQNHNVLKGLCAFLNSTLGGTLYLGVNDQGYVQGIEADMKHLHLQTIDSYLRYVQDTAKKYLGLDALTYLRIEPLYDNKVVAIHVEPHPYRLVELDGTAYLRVNAESREMPERVREEIIARKVFKDKNRAAAVSLLQHACSQRKCVVLHNYASSNSGSVKDRKVEPYDIRPEDGLFFALDYKDYQSKVFSINRVGYIEVLEAEGWKYPGSHQTINVDVFHMSGTRAIHISLQLDLMAKNLLIEEYPAAKNLVKAHKGDDNIWYFDADVYSLEGIGRFYIGLAKHIKILEGEELKKYMKAYILKLSF